MVNLLEKDILVLTETKLDTGIADGELCLYSYNVLRYDRNITTSSKSGGGGVLVAVGSHLNHRMIPSPCPEIEAVFVELSLDNHVKIVLGSAYIPPGQPLQVYQAFCGAVDEIMQYYRDAPHLIILGDFNLPSASNRESSQLLDDFCLSHEVAQYNRIVNQRGVTLDLIFCDMFCTVDRATQRIAHEDVHHPALNFQMKIPTSKVSNLAPVFVPNYFKCDLDSVAREIVAEGLHDFDSSEDLHYDVDRFVRLLGGIVQSNTPKKKVCSSPFPPWFSGELKCLTISKKRYHRLFKETGREVHYTQFAHLRDLCKIRSRQDHQDYIAHLDSVLPHNPKVFWSHIKQTRGSSSSTNTVKLGDHKSSIPSEMANLFATHFSSVYSLSPSNPPDYIDRSLECVSLLETTPCEVKSQLDQLDTGKGCGPDGIPPIVLKHSSGLLSQTLCNLFNRSLKTGIFPSALKTSHVVPIFKDGAKEDVKNYRPISIQSPIAKIFERIVLDRLRVFFARLNIDEQHGFSKGRSTVTNLVVFEEYVMDSFNRGRQVDCLYLDFSKAFDKVSHLHLLAKLKSCGISDPLLSWMKSYLIGRTSSVRYAGALSDPFEVQSGVPQGSILGPYLFNLFLQDIKEDIHTKFLCFADDIKLFLSIEDDSSVGCLQLSLDNISKWCSVNAMLLNISKCKVVTYSRSCNPLLAVYRIDGEEMTRCGAIKDLGVWFSSTFTSNQHIDDICSRASRLLGLLYRISRSGLSVASLVFLYKALIRQLLEYASTVWTPHQLYLSTRLQEIQRRFVSLLHFKTGQLLQPDLLEQMFNLHPLHLRRHVADLVFLFKIIRGTTDCPELLGKVNLRTPARTRSQDIFVHQHHRTNYLKNSPMSRTQEVGNLVACNVDFFHDSLISFRRRLFTLEPLLPR